jgi:hypothetical protein
MRSARRDDSDLLAADPHSYFPAMADMMAGMVFLLMILLAAMTILTKIEASHDEVAAPQVQELQRRIEEQRRIAEEQRNVLLALIQGDLDRDGLTARVDYDNGVVRLATADFFANGEVATSGAGEQKLRLFLDVLRARLPCYVGSTADTKCPPTAGQRLAIVRLDAFTAAADARQAGGVTTAVELSQARAVTVLSQLLANQPALYFLRAPDGSRLWRSAAYGAQWSPAPTLSDQSHIDLQLQMALPAELPDAVPVLR